jgi:REP element-mobilizing transposase RayT
MIHAVWGTKHRHPLLTKDVRLKIIQHIRENAKDKGIYIDRLNGYTDHLHCLFALNADMSLSKVLQMIKGESSFWINKQNLTPAKFEWANEYFASSVSESIVNEVRDYIDNQEEHHKKMTFEQEFKAFIEKHNLGRQG